MASERPHYAPLDWTPGSERYTRLVALWADPSISMTEIGRRLGATKNMIAGAVHRLGLPPRPSPIQSNNPEATRMRAQRAALRAAGRKPEPGHQIAPLPASAATLPPLASVVAAKVPPRRLPPDVAPAPPPPAPLPVRAGGCQWVTTERRPWAFCGKPVSSPGSPWCKCHLARVYQRRGQAVAEAWAAT